MKNAFTTIFGALLATFSMGYSAHIDTQSDSTTQLQTPVIRDVTPSAGPRVENGADVVITADFIYWQASESGLTYAINFLNTAGTSAPQGTTHNPKFTFNPGLKVGFGLQLGHDGWDVMAGYTWYNSSDSTDQTTNSDTTDYTTAVPIQNTIGGYTVSYNDSIINSASARWGMLYNDIDFEIGRNFFISQYLTLRPFTGLKAAWINQDFHVLYFTTDGDYSVTEDQNQKSFGIGLRTGMNGSWEFCKNFSIYGNTALSVLSTRFKNEYSEPYSSTIDSAPLIYINFNSIMNTIQPVIELGCGLSYDYWFHNDMYHFGISAGWEMQYWNSMNHFFGYSEAQVISRTGDLSIQGLDIKVRFDF